MKKLLALLSLLLVLGIPMSLVSAMIEDCGTQTITRGPDSVWVTGKYVMKTSDNTPTSSTPACVNLKGFQAPGIPFNVVSTNNLVFRVYRNDYSVSNHVNYKYYTAGEDCRQYMTYPSAVPTKKCYRIMCSLNSTSCSSSVSYYIKWNP